MKKVIVRTLNKIGNVVNFEFEISCLLDTEPQVIEKQEEQFSDHAILDWQTFEVFDLDKIELTQN